MERPSEHQDLAAALAELRPAPTAGFTAELDQRAAAGFPRRSRLDSTPLGGAMDWIRGLSPQRLLFTGGTAALAAIAIATVVVAGGDTSSENLALKAGSSAPRPHRAQLSAPVPEASRHSSGAAHSQASAGSATRSTTEASAQYDSAVPQSATSSELPSAANANLSANLEHLEPFSRRVHRDIERSAEVGLLADPADVADDSAAVFAAVHDVHGIVLRSTTTSGKRAGAHFELLIPSARLGDALAAFSAIDEVRTRHEATDDITAPTIAAGERLRDSRARIDGLLTQLSTAETETEMAAIEAELTRERRHAARLRAQLDKLEQRADFSRVAVRIETGGSSSESGGTWGINDAFGDGGHILGIAAGVTLVGLAVLAPIALLCLLAWLAHRAWLRRARNRALA